MFGWPSGTRLFQSEEGLTAGLLLQERASDLLLDTCHAAPEGSLGRGFFEVARYIYMTSCHPGRDEVAPGRLDGNNTSWAR